MIPKIIHQTWHSIYYDHHNGSPDSWKALNPDWEYMFWLDNDLELFVERNYPEFIKLYQSYPKIVQRTDLGRYLLMHKFGGVYADIDTDCRASLNSIHNENQIILCDEPRSHFHKIKPFGLNRLVFNGTLASPAGHPFWYHVAERANLNRHAMQKDVLVSTGPIMFSSAIENWPIQADFSLNSCHLYSELEKSGEVTLDEEVGDHARLRLSQHNWAASWYTLPKNSFSRALRSKTRRLKSRLTRKAQPINPLVINALDQTALHEPLPKFHLGDLPRVAVFTPVKDGSLFLDTYMDLISSLDWPKDKLRLVFCEGDSTDDTFDKLQKIKRENGRSFAGFEIIKHALGYKLERRNRWHSKYQFNRRSVLAKVRNSLITNGLTVADEWVLWLDVDVCNYSASILKTLLNAQEKIVVPDCVLDAGGKSFDMNSFLHTGEIEQNFFFKHVLHGLFQPPSNYWQRLHLSDLRFADKIPLTGVGGTMLLVHSSVHRSGLYFPERPYKYHIETEGFGMMAKDAGICPYGLPNETIFHVKS
jgi:hypothetical protein